MIRKFDFNKTLKKLNGEDMLDQAKEPFVMSKVLANNLDALNKGQLAPRKARDWAVMLYNGEHLQVDKTDQQMLEKLIETGFEGMSAGVRAQLLEVFDNPMPNEPVNS